MPSIVIEIAISLYAVIGLIYSGTQESRGSFWAAKLFFALLDALLWPVMLLLKPDVRCAIAGHIWESSYHPKGDFMVTLKCTRCGKVIHY